jgi:hypothetical protein
MRQFLKRQDLPISMQSLRSVLPNFFTVQFRRLSNSEQPGYANHLIIERTPSPGEADQSKVWEAFLIRIKTGVL